MKEPLELTLNDAVETKTIKLFAQHYKFPVRVPTDRDEPGGHVAEAAVFVPNRFL